MGLHVTCGPGIELAVDKSVQENFGFVAGHFGCPPASIHASRNMERARARRNITVPTGRPITSRNTHGSDATRPWIVSPYTLEIIAISGVSCGSVHIGTANSELSASVLMSRNSTTERRAYSALHTLRRIANIQGLIVGLRAV